MTSRWAAGVVTIAALAAGGCAVRLGGAGPRTFTAVALANASGDAATVAAGLMSESADVVLLSASQDSAWFGELASQTALTLSGPGRTGGPGLALLSRLKVLGDTVLDREAGDGALHIVDALYEVDKNRQLDMMLMSMAPGTGAREAVRSLLSYYATDVGGTSAVLLAFQASTPLAADSVALLLRSAFGNVLDCGAQDGESPQAGAGVLRFFYGPTARIECQRGRLLTDAPPTIVGRVVVGR